MKRFLRSLAVFVLALVSVAAYAQQAAEPPKVEAPKIDEQVKQSVLTDLTMILTTTAFVPGVDFEKWPTLIADFKDQIDKAQTTDDFTGTVNTALSELGFSHILLFSPRMAEQRVTNKIVGIGVRIQIEDKGIRVVRVFDDGAAAGAGIKIGDLIIEADGKPVHTPADLAGKAGEPVKITIDRNGVIIQRDLVRKEFSTVIPEELSWPEKDVALLTIPSFDQSYDEQHVQDLMAEAESAKHLIIDLRGNGGGRVSNLRHLSSFFLTREQPLGTFVDKSAIKHYEEETGDADADVFKVAKWDTKKLLPLIRNKPPFKGDVAVLIDGGTGSASEMFAAALKEQRGATLIGSRSVGAVLASVMTQISDGFLIQYPLMDYVTIKGVRLEGNPLVPDKDAAPPKYGEPDEGVTEAVKMFKKEDIGSAA
ncbi:MAG TPA: S41 family peptidase [Fimbriimonadaceae bacterium]|nr:S41 family peptidase [Fimbriimonadaceae bacterium]